MSGRKPAVGLFAGQEIRLIKGPLFVGQDHVLGREIVTLSESARTESVWVRTRVDEGAESSGWLEGVSRERMAVEAQQDLGN